MEKLINLVSQFNETEKLKDEDREELKTLGAIDKPPMGILPYDDAVQKYNPQAGESLTALVKVKDVFSDPKYNRTQKIHYGNIKRDLNKVGGFSYKNAGVLSGFVRPNGQIVSSKGNHRTSGAYGATGDEETVVPMELTFHSKDISYDEMIKIEASDHNVDCNYRTSQGQEDKFKTSYYAGEDDAIELYNFLDEYRAGIGDTNPHSNYTVKSHSWISKSRKLNEYHCRRYMKVFTKLNISEEIYGFALHAGVYFLKRFRESIHSIDTSNNTDSFELFMKYMYQERSDKTLGFLSNVTQSDLTKGSGSYKGSEITVGRMISVYNEFCEKVGKYNIPTNNKTAIGYSSKEYLEFIKNTDETVRLTVDDVSKATFNPFVNTKTK